MKLLALILLLFSIDSNVNAQQINAFGIKTGLTRANQYYDYSKNFILNDQDFTYRNGVNVGVFAEITEIEYFSVVVNLYYNQKGMCDEMEITWLYNSPSGYKSEKIQIDNRLEYLTLAACGKFRYDFNNISPYVLTGLKYDILIDKKVDRSLEKLFEPRIAINNYYDIYDGNLIGLIPVLSNSLILMMLRKVHFANMYPRGFSKNITIYIS